MISWDLKKRSLRPIGLDIGHSSIKMIQLAVNGENISIHAAEEANIEIDTNGNEQARNNLIISTIKRMINKGNFHSKNVISCLPSGELKITSLRLTEAESQKIEQVLKREVTQRFGLDSEKDAMDYIVAGNVRQGDEIKNELVLFATDGQIIKNHIDMIEQTGLRPVAIDIIPCALFRNFERALRRQEDRENAVVFVDIGSCYTTIVFRRGGEICFVKQIKIGAGNFNREVAAKLGITSKEAEILRRELQAENQNNISDSAGQDISHQKNKIEASTRQGMIDAISIVSEQLAKEISLCLRYYSVTFRGKRVERAVFTGGGSYENILMGIMRRQLTVDVEIAQPLRGFDISNERVGFNLNNNKNELMCEWAIAVGLSLKGWKAVGQNKQQVRCGA